MFAGVRYERTRIPKDSKKQNRHHSFRLPEIDLHLHQHEFELKDAERRFLTKPNRQYVGWKEYYFIASDSAQP